MPIYRIIKMWFFMPGIFIVLLVLMGMYLRASASFIPQEKAIRKFHLLGSWFCVLLAGLFYLLTINSCAQRLLHSLEYQYAVPQITKVDAIYVLGAPEDIRVETAYKVYTKTEAAMVVSGYCGEAERMQKYLLQQGVPESKIIVEPLASNTREHVKYMLPIAKERGYKKIYVVTSAYHMPRSMLNFEGPFKTEEIEVIPYPCGHRTPKLHEENELEYLPNWESMLQSNIAVNEYLGIGQLKLLQ